ncbi:hypothetical protein Tco_1072515 [Tanacetum coccineum]
MKSFDTSAGNPVKEILLKLNLPDHRILKMEVKCSSNHLSLSETLSESFHTCVKIFYSQSLEATPPARGGLSLDSRQ